MGASMLPIPNVAHVAGPLEKDGQTKCARCHAPIGEYIEFQDEDQSWKRRPWAEGEIVLEVLNADNRTFFTNQAAGVRQECIDG